jgi:hypothetical protein
VLFIFGRYSIVDILGCWYFRKLSMQTRLTTLLGIQYPLVLSGMSWISTPELVAAVSNAGGLGVLALGPLSPEETRVAILKIRSLTDKPFGVGCTLLMPGAKENAEVALELQVPVINFSLGKGDWLIDLTTLLAGFVNNAFNQHVRGRDVVDQALRLANKLHTGFQVALFSCCFKPWRSCPKAGQQANLGRFNYQPRHNFP